MTHPKSSEPNLCMYLDFGRNLENQSEGTHIRENMQTGLNWDVRLLSDSANHYATVLPSFLSGSVLSYQVLFCSMRFCSIRFCSVLSVSVLFYEGLFYQVLLCSVRFCSIRFCFVLSDLSHQTNRKWWEVSCIMNSPQSGVRGQGLGLTE